MMEDYEGKVEGQLTGEPAAKEATIERTVRPAKIAREIGKQVSDFTLKKTGAAMVPCPREDCRHYKTWSLMVNPATGEMVAPEEPDVPCRFCNKWAGFSFYRLKDKT